MNISQKAMEDHSSQLHFDPVRREHHGNYTCLAKNLADSTSISTQLTVQCKTFFRLSFICIASIVDSPIFLGPNTTFVYSVPNYRGELSDESRGEGDLLSRSACEVSV